MRLSGDASWGPSSRPACEMLLLLSLLLSMLLLLLLLLLFSLIWPPATRLEDFRAALASTEKQLKVPYAKSIKIHQNPLEIHQNLQHPPKYCSKLLLLLSSLLLLSLSSLLLLSSLYCYYHYHY